MGLNKKEILLRPQAIIISNNIKIRFILKTHWHLRIKYKISHRRRLSIWTWFSKYRMIAEIIEPQLTIQAHQIRELVWRKGKIIIWQIKVTSRHIIILLHRMKKQVCFLGIILDQIKWRMIIIIITNTSTKITIAQLISITKATKTTTKM